MTRQRPLGKTARNEKLKLAASFFNSLAVSAVVAAFVVPGVGITEHRSPDPYRWHLVFVVACWCFFGVWLHIVAQAFPGRLVD
ncbi:hypothetical protein [Acidisoma silvae]|uniref:Uncharacterized protein n=1 Tax=Acidisoma silvae TaxID=2802396 RepID=A0A964DXB4_9PROT|nr:hypothetical protein [Acidisoma silvae]MCB8874110.1 hypothetical protein [Acidisoma silvae]